jgi:hypothetical protein
VERVPGRERVPFEGEPVSVLGESFDLRDREHLAHAGDQGEPFGGGARAVHLPRAGPGLPCLVFAHPREAADVVPAEAVAADRLKIAELGPHRHASLPGQVLLPAR